MGQPVHPHRDQENTDQYPEFRHCWFDYYGAGIFSAKLLSAHDHEQ